MIDSHLSQIRPNTRVRYKADPATAGWVIDISGDSARVFIDGYTKLVPLSELEPAPGLTETSPQELRIALTRHRLENPLTNQLLSYRASKTDLYYHQFLPVKKMLESPDQRLLIADEVGIGKTIEAGLIWAELESRALHGLENVWVICPKSLVGKWQEEMLQRFDLQLKQLSSEDLSEALDSLERDGVLPPAFAKSIVNLELIRTGNRVAKLGQSSIAWDLVVFDEAHHLRNPETLSHSLAKLVCERSKAAVFLTATPLQTTILDIVHLMEALGVDVAEDPDLLQYQLLGDKVLNFLISLLRRRPAGWSKLSDAFLDNLEFLIEEGRPGLKEFRHLVSNSDLLDRRQRTVVVEAARDLQILSPFMTRTLRSDVEEDRRTREAITRTVTFSPEEQAFYDAVYKICLARADDAGAPPGFITQMPERRCASCVPAVASEILKYATEDEDTEHDARFSPDEVRALEPFARAALASQDLKLEALCEILKTAFGDLDADRVMIFSTFRGTLHYLERQLRNKGYSLELMYGPTPARDEDCRPGEKSRERIGAEFRRGEFQILLASEVAGEGLDFEHCHVLINYDLPWNPMRVEQRIGRCDRLGQRSEKVHIGSLSSVGTIEQRILSRLYQRLRIFEQALGDLEVILGEQVAAFEREVFTRRLSPEQQDERLERIAQAIENRDQQRQSIGQSNVISLQGRQLIESDQQEIKDAEYKFLAPEEVAEFVYSTLESHLPTSIRRRSVSCEFDVTGTQELKDALQGLLRAHPASHYARTEIARFRTRLDQQRRTRVSFVEHGDGLEFVHTRHPLVLLARRLAREPLSDVPYCVGIAPASVVDEPTALVWAVGSLEGYTSRAELLCATVDYATRSVTPIAVAQAQEWLRSLSPAPHGVRETHAVAEEQMNRAEHSLLSQFAQVTAIFNSRNELLTSKARHAVRSHAKRELGRFQRQLSRDDLKESIRNLYRGWSRRIEAETQSKMDEIDQKSQVRSSLQIIGVAVIHPDDSIVPVHE